MTLFNEEQEEVEGALTPEEVQEKIDEAKAEAEATVQEKVDKLESDLEDNKTILNEAIEEAEKEKEKAKNFSKVRGKVDEKDARIKELEEKHEKITERIEEIGVEQWLREQKKLYTCPQCEGEICVHDEECYDCGLKINPNEK